VPGGKNINPNNAKEMIMKTIPVLRLRIMALIATILFACGIVYAEAEKTRSERPPVRPFIISNQGLIEDIAGNPVSYPKYTTQLMNLANQNAQSTRPRHVGQLSDLIQQYKGQSYTGWVEFYLERYPDAIDQAADRTYAMIENMRAAMQEIDRDMVKKWVEELVLTKTFAGLKYHETILREIAAREETTHRLARPEEEATGIDGYIGDRPISIKPASYKAKSFLPEDIEVDIIFYEKTIGGIRVFYEPPAD
jgi:hypothetical protein